MNVETMVVSARSDKKSPSKSQAFIEYIISRCQGDNGLRACLTRADNPATEYQSWEVLAGFHVNLEYESERLPYATIGAAIARAKAEKNGTVSIGQAIARCYEDDNGSDQAKAKLRRLLACDSVVEVCRVIRPLLSLVESKCSNSLNYASLLNDLLWFGHSESQTRIKAGWAQSFYGKSAEEGEHE